MKRILILGATSAIATACAREWAGEGAHFFLVGRDPERLAGVAADLVARGAQAAHTHALDLTDCAAHPAMLQGCLAALGGIDLALVAHGTLPDQAACERDPALALREFASNGTSVIALLTLLANQFEAQRSGTIGVITSVAGDRGRPSNYVYGSAKAAVAAFCEGLRARLHKSGVHVVDIKPGFVATPMTRGLPLPGPLVAQPEAVARRIVAGMNRRVPVLYAPAFWAPIMLVIRSIPRFAFNRMKL